MPPSTPGEGRIVCLKASSPAELCLTEAPKLPVMLVCIEQMFKIR